MSRFSNLFYFIKSDRTVWCWLIIVIACIALLFYFDDGNRGKELPMAERDSTWYSSTGGYGKRGYNNNNYRNNGRYHNRNERDYSNGNESWNNRRPAHLHPFDLNSAEPDELYELGFSERQIASIMKYRSKGGIYRHKEQMSKISGMTKGQYDALAPYFTVGDDYRPASDFVEVPTQTAFSKGAETSEEENNIAADNDINPFPQKLKPGETIVLNHADTTELMKVPGIGTHRAQQIVAYREKLGGFYSVSQLNDLENVPESTHAYFTLGEVTLRKIRINRLSINKLVNHPYISFVQAKTIVEYRRNKGQIKSLYELRLNDNFPEDFIKRLEPYIDYE